MYHVPARLYYQKAVNIENYGTGKNPAEIT